MASLIASWQWKVEPVSPAFVPVNNEPDAWLFEDDETHSSASLPEEKPFQPTRAEIASKLLEDLDEWIKEEPFSDWLEEKIDLPIFEDLPAVESRAYGHFPRGNNEAVKPLLAVDVKGFPASPTLLTVANDTQTLLQEFESVFGEVELNNGTLTPPQSPTLPSYPSVLAQDSNGGQLLITTLQQLIPVQTFTPAHSLTPANNVPVNLPPIVPLVPIVFPEKKEPLLDNCEQMVPVTPMPDLARELADVDELIRTRVEDLETSGQVSNSWSINTPGDSSSDFSSVTPPSPCTSSSSSFESGEELCDDPEWIPVSVQSPAPGNQKSTGSRKRGKPYARTGFEDKRMRKKEQNKNAATRYRQKKKAEIEEILSEEKGLEDTNNDLRLKVNDLAREIKYLKGLMRDVFKAKGLIK